MDDASISGGSVGVYVNANDASTSIDIDHSTIEGARVAGIQWEALNSKLDSLSLNAPTFKNNTVDILLPNVDSSDSSSDNNILFNAMYLSSDVTFSFPNVKDSCTAGGIDSTDTLAHLKADKGAFEMDDTGIIMYNAKGSSTPTVKQDPDAVNYVIKTKNTTSDKSPTDAITSKDTYSIAVDVSAAGFNAGAAPYNEEYEIKYRASKDEDWTTTLPTKPGTYYVQFYVEGNKNFNAGWVSGEDLKFTIVKPELALSDFGFSQSAGVVYQSTIEDETLSITTVFYDADGNEVTDLDSYGKPKNLGTYKVGFRVAESNTYQAYDSNGPVKGWEFTVKPAPEAKNFKVELTVNNTPYDLDKVTDTVVVSSDAAYKVTASEIGSSTSMVYPCYRNTSDPDADWELFENGYPTELGTYQIRLEVSASSDASYSSGYVTSDKWVFTISAPKQDPDPNAYAVTYDGSQQKSRLVYYSELEENNYKTLGDLPLGYEAVKDVTGYGTASLHYYKATQNKGGFVSSDWSIDYTTEYPATYDLIPGAIYYVVVETAETDAYTAARYTDHGMYIVLGKPDPEAANYPVMLNTANGTDALWKESTVDYNETWSIDTRPNPGTGAVEKILYRDVADAAAAWSTEKPTVPGTYAVALKVAEGDKYASADCLTCDDWRITINKGVLDNATIATYFVFDGSNVSVSDEHADFAKKVGEITTVYYDENGNPVTDLDEDGLPKNPGTYGVGFKTEGTDYYEAYNSNGPVGDWELTVLAAPTADQYQVTLNGKDITKADPIDYAENIANRSKIRAYSTSIYAGNVTAYHYAMVKDGQPDTSILYDEFPTVPGTYQVYLDVRAGTVYAAKKGLTDPAWQFTIGQSELTPDAFTYDSSTNTITSRPFGVSSDDVTIQYYYTEDGELVTNFVKDANGNNVPRKAGTYQVGVTVKETEFYKGGTLTGAETGWTYEKPKNIVTIDDFAVTAPDAEIEYTGEPVTVKAEPNDNIQPVQSEVVYYDVTDGYPGTKLDKAPTDAGTYTWSILVTADENTEFSSELVGHAFTITKKAELDNTAVTVTVPEMREGADNSFDVTVSSNDETLSADDLEITYYDKDGTELTEAPTTEGTYFYSIKIKADAKTINFQPGATLTDKNGNTKFAYTIKPTAYTADTSYGDVNYKGKDQGEPLTAGMEVTVTAPTDTDTSAFRQWIITVDGEEIDATAEGLAKLGVPVDDDAAALELLQKSPFTFTMPKGDVKISALTSNPQQEAFEQAAGTALIVTGAAAATGAVYYFGTTAYIRSQLPEGMAVPQNREQLAVALWTLAGKPATESTTVFTDVAADSEALPAIRWAVATGVMNANTTEDGTSFLAGNYVTRAETAYRIYKLQQQRTE